MKVSVDTVADAAAIDFCDEPVGRLHSVLVAPGVRLDLDERGQAVSVEVLGLKRRMAHPAAVVVEVTSEPGEALPADHPMVVALQSAAGTEPPAAAAG